jgi:hypothetical protein
MGCDNMHRITSKSQHPPQDNVQFNVTLNVRYDLSYTYGTDEGKKFHLADVTDVNYRTVETPGEDANVKNSHAYEYDADGERTLKISGEETEAKVVGNYSIDGKRLAQPLNGLNLQKLSNGKTIKIINR